MSPVYCGQVISKPKILPVFAKQYCQEDFLLVLASLEQKEVHPKCLDIAIKQIERFKKFSRESKIEAARKSPTFYGFLEALPEESYQIFIDILQQRRENKNIPEEELNKLDILLYKVGVNRFLSTQSPRDHERFSEKNCNNDLFFAIQGALKPFDHLVCLKAAYSKALAYMNNPPRKFESVFQSLSSQGQKEYLHFFKTRINKGFWAAVGEWPKLEKHLLENPFYRVLFYSGGMYPKPVVNYLLSRYVYSKPFCKAQIGYFVEALFQERVHEECLHVGIEQIHKHQRVLVRAGFPSNVLKSLVDLAMLRLDKSASPKKIRDLSRYLYPVLEKVELSKEEYRFYGEYFKKPKKYHTCELKEYSTYQGVFNRSHFLPGLPCSDFQECVQFLTKYLVGMQF